MRFYNTLTGKKEEFIPIRKGMVGMYTCGPTVYDFAHIGNFRAYIFEDLLRRYLKLKGYRVRQVMNITDVDDKTINHANAEGLSLGEFTKKYTDAFFEDLKTLKIEPAEFYPKATEHIKDMVRLVKRLLKKGYAYKSDGSIYFRISRFKDYGRLSKIDPSQMKSGIRVDLDEYGKEDLRDFALWKKVSKAGEPFWDTVIGKGRPGWHIECSAMSMKYLGEKFDIHTGGEDNIFPHHENEIAQSEAATGKRFVNCWMHCRFLLVSGEKMAKSKGNYLTLRDLLAKGYDPRAIRYLLLSTHYRMPLNFTLEGIEQGASTIDGLIDFLQRVRAYRGKASYNEQLAKEVAKASADFDQAMDDDLNISQALASAFELVKVVNVAMEEGYASEENLHQVYDLFMRWDKLLDVLKWAPDAIPEEIEDLIRKREEARRKKDYELADRIRQELGSLGIILEDTKEGVRWKRAKVRRVS